MRSFVVKNKLFVVLTSILFVLTILFFCSEKKVYRDCQYEDIHDVALYLKTYHELPSNYVTQQTRYHAPDDDQSFIVGGDTFYYEKTYEDDFNKFHLDKNSTLKKGDRKVGEYHFKNKRGKYRFLYTTNTDHVRVFTCEHPDKDSGMDTDTYIKFKEITDFELMPAHSILLYVVSISSILYVFYIFYLIVSKHKRKTNS